LKTLGGRRHELLVKELTKKRKAVGLTQDQLANELQVYQSYIARLESGQRRVDVVEFIKLSEVLKFDAATLIEELSNSPE